jgi:uncharacterized membrane protein YtjA (UPF0391 family)
MRLAIVSFLACRRNTARLGGISDAVAWYQRLDTLYQRLDTKEGDPMLYYALMFLVVGLIAGALGLFGVAAVAGQIAWILFLVGVVLIVVHMVTGRRPTRELP